LSSKCGNPVTAVQDNAVRTPWTVLAYCQSRTVLYAHHGQYASTAPCSRQHTQTNCLISPSPYGKLVVGSADAVVHFVCRPFNPQSAGGAVEKWLIECEAAMRDTVKSVMKESFAAHTRTPRETWMVQWPGQVLLAGADPAVSFNLSSRLPRSQYLVQCCSLCWLAVCVACSSAAPRRSDLSR
jgi:hypothetical protein